MHRNIETDFLFMRIKKIHVNKYLYAYFPGKLSEYLIHRKTESKVYTPKTTSAPKDKKEKKKKTGKCKQTREGLKANGGRNSARLKFKGSNLNGFLPVPRGLAGPSLNTPPSYLSFPSP